MKIRIILSQKLKNLREERNITQEMLAKQLGVSRQSIISLEQGRCLPSLPLALSLAEIFETNLENFLEIKRREVKKMERNLGPWSPMRELSSLHETIDHLFEEALPVSSSRPTAMPLINVYEKDNMVVVEAELPGVKEENLSIEVAEDRLTIYGEKKEESETREKNYYRKETIFGSFSRTIALPAEVDKDNAEAELNDGLLKITLPKKAEVKPKIAKIKVKRK